MTISSAQFVGAEEMTPKLIVKRKSSMKAVIERMQHARQPFIPMERLLVNALISTLTIRR